MNSSAKLTLGSALGVLMADLLSKWLVQAHFALHESVAVMPGVWLTYVMNPGAAFSMFATWSAPLRLPLFIAVTLGALWAAWHYWKGLPQADRFSALALGMVVGGAVGNLLDRVRYGEVVDFILVDLGFWPMDPWPIFNVADSAVCVGVGLLIYRSLKPYKA